MRFAELLPQLRGEDGRGDAMSRPRYDWWGYAKGMIRRYPGGVTARERWAVSEAVRQTLALPDGEARMKLVDVIFWRRSHTLPGAAALCHVSERTARRWHTGFVFLVAREFGLME